MARCRCVCNGQVKILSVAIALFLSITGVQFFFALYAHSNALLVDCASMLVDSLTYVGNLWGACAAGDERDRGGGGDGGGTRDALAMACASIVVLYGITAWGLVGAIESLLDPDVEDDLEPKIVLAFGVFGLAFDGVALVAFRYWGDEEDDDDLACDDFGTTGVMLRGWDAASDDDDDDDDDGSGGGGGRPGPGDDARLGGIARSADEMNMCSAFSHVLADAVRSLTSIGLGLAVLLDPSLNGARWDACATIVITSTILFGSMALAGDWCRLTCNLLKARRALRDRRPPAARRAPDPAPAAAKRLGAAGGEESKSPGDVELATVRTSSDALPAGDGELRDVALV